MPGLQMTQAKILEAVLFAAGDSVPLNQLAVIIECDAPATRNLLLHMAERYADEDSGIQLIELEDHYQLCTNPKYHMYAQNLRPAPPRKSLTQPLLETLSIIAYKQPVTKAMIEEIRGVNADHAVNKLMEYGLITEQGRLEAPGKPILFGTSEDFLRNFGLRNVSEFLQQIPVPTETVGEFIDEVEVDEVEVVETINENDEIGEID